MRDRSAALVLVAAAACWGSTIVAIKLAERRLPALGVTAIELSAGVAVLAVACWPRRHAIARLPWPALAAGLLEPGAAYVLINLGLTRTSGLDGALLIGTESLFIVMLVAARERRAPGVLALCGLVLALAGSAAVTAGGGQASVGGDLLVGAGSLAAAGYVVITHHYAGRVDPVAVTAGQFAIGWLVTLVAVVAAGPLRGENPLHGATGAAVGAAVCAGLIGSALGFLLYNSALARVSAMQAALALTLIPLFGALFSLALLGASVTAGSALAGVAILAGVAVTQWSETRHGPAAGWRPPVGERRSRRARGRGAGSIRRGPGVDRRVASQVDEEPPA